MSENVDQVWCFLFILEFTSYFKNDLKLIIQIGGGIFNSRRLSNRTNYCSSGCYVLEGNTVVNFTERAAVLAAQMNVQQQIFTIFRLHLKEIFLHLVAEMKVCVF